MRTLRNLVDGAVALLLATSTLAPIEAGAIDLDLARKCNAMLAKQFPPRTLGNPAAGSAKGNAQAERDYFKKCTDNGGNMDSAPDKNSK